MQNDPSLSDGSIIYLLGAMIGALASAALMSVADRKSPQDKRLQYIQAIACAAGVLGGLLGIALFGPMIQIGWRDAADWLAGTPGASADHGWPHPVSLWYSAGFLGSLLGATMLALVARAITKPFVKS